MRPGIVVQHGRLPVRSRDLVRCDVTAIIGFIAQEKWSDGQLVGVQSAGDFLEIVLRREADLLAYPDRGAFDAASLRAVRNFFVNGGDTLHLFGVCIRSAEDLKSPASVLGVLQPLLDRLRSEDDIAIIASPAAAYLPCEISRTGQVQADSEVLYEQLLDHCREMNNRFLLIDPPLGLHGDLLVRWARRFRERASYNRSYGALYYPWLNEGDQLFPPSSALAGVFVRTERERGDFGVVWPPANVVVKGVTHLEVELDWNEAAELADDAINPLVLQPGRGVVVFGARTLLVAERREDPYQFVNSRRVISMISEQLRRDNAWVVFEINNPHLWDVLNRDIRYRLEQFWRAGLLTGARPGETYSVLCDHSNNPRQSLDAGQVHVEVRMQPVGTTEQIVIDLRLGESA